jgi:hypothetical protein
VRLKSPGIKDSRIQGFMTPAECSCVSGSCGHKLQELVLQPWCANLVVAEDLFCLLPCCW